MPKTISDETFLVIDAGTQSIRAAIIDGKGAIRSIVKTPIVAYVSPKPGWAEQDPDYYWKVLCQTTTKLIRTSGRAIRSVCAVSFTTQRGTVINLDKNGRPLRPAIVWLDQRKASKEGWPPPLLAVLFRSINMYEAAVHTYRDTESNWICQNQPEVWEKTHKYLLLSGFFAYKLTGEFVESSGNMVGYFPFDYRRHQWMSRFDFKKGIFNYDISLLPRLVKPTELMGYVTKQASRETGIPAGLPVIAAAADKACEVLGSGCLTPDIACLSYGTTATVETTTSRYVEVVPFFPPYPSAVPGAYNTEVMIYRGYWMVNWFKKEFGLREEQIAKKRGIAPEELFDEMVQEIPPGSMGLILQPYWSPGVKIPGPEAKGSIIGFGDVHTRAHIYRAILEGLAYSLKEGALRTQSKNGIPITRVRVSGGGSQSRVAMQVTADIFDLPAERPHTFETSALGAAIDAAVGMKMYPDFPSAVAAMTRIRDVFEPIPARRDIYRDLYEKVYLKIYDRLKPLYEAIRDITGYPEKIV